jgi:hypothetical protein
VVVVLMMNLYL